MEVNDEQRLYVRVLLARTGYDAHGMRAKLAEELNINRNSISMALSGYRSTASAARILSAIRKHLQDKIPKPYYRVESHKSS